jgi:hypothetical protein
VLEAGKKFRHLIQFTSGQPTSDLTYTLYNQDGDVVLTETAPIIDGQLSYIIEIPAGSNTLSKPLFEQMTLEWEYDTATEAITDSITYTLHLPIGFPVSKTGVRDLLGVDSEELPDDEINLFEGFLQFRELVGEDADLAAYQDAGDFDSFRITKAIEAATALMVFPTLQVRLPKRYDSGTSSYERWNNINWEALQTDIFAKMTLGVETIDPEYELWPTIDIFVLSDVGTDPITGE